MFPGWDASPQKSHPTALYLPVPIYTHLAGEDSKNQVSFPRTQYNDPDRVLPQTTQYYMYVQCPNKPLGHHTSINLRVP